MKKKNLALLTALALLLALFTACGGGQQNKPEPSPAPLPSENTESAQSSGTPSPAPAETPPDQPDEPADTQEPADAPQPEPEDVQPEEDPAPEDAQPSGPVSAPAEPEPEPEPAPEPAPEPEPEPEPEGESVRAGDTYTISVTLEGGTGRATVESPAKLRYDETGKCWATIVWSSPNFDYMKVDGEKYELISEPGANSTFEIPVSAFNQPLTVIADTVAMSEPHEVEYTLTFDSASMQDA